MSNLMVVDEKKEEDSISGKDGRDPNYVCPNHDCGGNLIVVKKENSHPDDNERKIYHCDKICGGKEMAECTVCHHPRSSWIGNGEVCTFCALDYLSGASALSLSDEQIAGIERWKLIYENKNKGRRHDSRK